jgi:hypothetical protein
MDLEIRNLMIKYVCVEREEIQVLQRVVACLQAGNEFITKRFDAGLECGRVLGLPVRSILTRNSMAASEADIENVFGVVAIVTRQVAIGKAELTQCEASPVEVKPFVSPQIP